MSDSYEALSLWIFSQEKAFLFFSWIFSQSLWIFSQSSWNFSQMKVDNDYQWLWNFSQSLWIFSQLMIMIISCNFCVFFHKLCEFFHRLCEIFHKWTVVHMSIYSYNLVNFFTIGLVKFFTNFVKFLIYVNNNYSHFHTWNFSQGLWFFSQRLWIFSHMNGCSYEYTFI